MADVSTNSTSLNGGTKKVSSTKISLITFQTLEGGWLYPALIISAGSPNNIFLQYSTKKNISFQLGAVSTKKRLLSFSVHEKFNSYFPTTDLVRQKKIVC